jgi:glycosyltransferase involved in cell wall biosynthesis
LRDDVLEGTTGFVCRPRDPEDLASAIERYFHSDMYRDRESRRYEIRRYANERYSWLNVAKATESVYRQLLAHA